MGRTRGSPGRKAWYFLRLAGSLARGTPRPVVGGISLTDVCNLDCVHCWRKNQGAGHVPLGQVLTSLRTLYAMGARYLYIQGGEPFTWQDGSRRLDHVVDEAKGIGFFHVAVCTNGTFPLDAEPDSFSVSLEGRPGSHDAIRSGSFERVIGNVAASRHPNIFANATFNRQNQEDLAFLAEFAASSRQLRGILVNFHIPYPGVEHLALSMEERARLARQAMELKRRGYPILNTYGGLRALARNNWRRPLDLSVVTDCRTYYSCCRARGNDRICRECGYAGWAELAQVFAWDIRSVFEVLGKLHRRPKR
ncbi:MAG: radical SAM protein [Thermoguttaceae bacterium]|jgi:MoaA/NifB/PqqE/SkfB family radical SAM enzyme